MDFTKLKRKGLLIPIGLLIIALIAVGIVAIAPSHSLTIKDMPVVKMIAGNSTDIGATVPYGYRYMDHSMLIFMHINDTKEPIIVPYNGTKDDSPIQYLAINWNDSGKYSVYNLKTPIITNQLTDIEGSTISYSGINVTSGDWNRA